MRPLPLVYIVVVTWNGWPYTVRCLDSLRTLDYLSYDILTVDNGSTDDSVQQIRTAHPDLELVALGRNLGFAGGANVGIRYALQRGAEYVWVLNNDVEVEPDTLTPLVEVARLRSGVGIVGPTVWRPSRNGKAEAEPAAFNWRGEHRLPDTCPSPDAWNGEAFHSVDDLVGSSTLMDAAMLREIGLFDERFFHYWDDVEICARARKAGWLVAHACRSRIWHAVGAAVPTTSAQAQYYFVRNWLLFSRWSGRGGLLTIFRRAPRMTLGRVLGRRWLFRGGWHMALAGLFGIIDAQRGRYGQRTLPRWLG
jgi:GT2 family glycosyltransferase